VTTIIISVKKTLVLCVSCVSCGGGDGSSDDSILYSKDYSFVCVFLVPCDSNHDNDDDAILYHRKDSCVCVYPCLPHTKSLPHQEISSFV
jgi:hypothetical protein